MSVPPPRERTSLLKLFHASDNLPSQVHLDLKLEMEYLFSLMERSRSTNTDTEFWRLRAGGLPANKTGPRQVAETGAESIGRLGQKDVLACANYTGRG